MLKSRITIRNASVLVWSIWMLFASPLPSQADDANFAQSLFFGEGAAEITATLRGTGIDVPAKSFACANCHGRGGEGGGEGSSLAPSFAPWAKAAQGNAKMSSDFFNAVANGVATDGHALSPNMPSYKLSKAQSDLLLSFIGRLHEQEQAGLTTSINVALVIFGNTDKPADISMKSLQAATASAGFAEGIWGKPWSFSFLPAGAAPSSDIAILIGGISGMVTSKDTGLAEPIHFPEITLLSPGQNNHIVAKQATVEQQFAALLERVATAREPCAIVTGEGLLSKRLLEQWQDSEKKAGTLRCLPWKAGLNPEPKSIVLLTARQAEVRHFANQTGSTNKSVYGLFDQLLPIVKSLVADGFKLVLADPHPTLTDKALATGRNLRILHLEKAIAELSSAIADSGSTITRQKLLKALRSIQSPPEKIRLLEL